jgi:hypothetical protein
MKWSFFLVLLIISSCRINDKKIITFDRTVEVASSRESIVSASSKQSTLSQEYELNSEMTDLENNSLTSFISETTELSLSWEPKVFDDDTHSLPIKKSLEYRELVNEVQQKESSPKSKFQKVIEWIYTVLLSALLVYIIWSAVSMDQ